MGIPAYTVLKFRNSRLHTHIAILYTTKGAVKCSESKNEHYTKLGYLLLYLKKHILKKLNLLFGIGHHIAFADILFQSYVFPLYS